MGGILPQVLIFVFDLSLSIEAKRSLAAQPPAALEFMNHVEIPIA
jgi:hypothetical protein